MFSSFTSILPSGLGFSKLEKEREREYERERVSNERAQGAGEVTPRVDASDGRVKESAPVDEHGVKKRRERNPNETFIVVRPPPSVSNHPLNLQLQLVPPQGKERSASGTSSASGVSDYSSRPSGDYNVQTSEEGGGGGTGDPLSRAQSLRSNRSDPASFYASSSASMSSIASTASTASTASGRRMIVPLYNLSAHNVITNTVLDAGTDAKIAKFHKRGMEILGLAMLEVVEVWPSYGRSGLGPGHVAFLSTSNGANTGAAGAGGSTFDYEGLLVTPTSSAISLSSAGSHPHAHTHTHAQSHPYVQSPTGYAIAGTPKTPTQGGSSAYGIGSITPTPSPSASGAKRIFGKIFKKRDSRTPESISEGGSSDPLSRMAPTSIDVPAVRSSSSQTELRQGTRTGTGLGVFSSTGKRRSVNASSPTPSHFNLPPVPGSPSAAGTTDRGGGSAKEQQQLQPAVLGIQPTLSAPVVPPAGRATRYVWIVRKWLKGDDSGLLGGVMRNVGGMVGGIGVSGLGPGGSLGSLSTSGHAQGLSGGEVGVEVRFEWVRGQSKSQEKRSLRKAAALAKSGSTSFSQEDAGASASTQQRSRRSIGAERSSEGRQQPEKSRSRGRGNAPGRPATSAGTVTGPSASATSPRFSGESRRSAERTSPNSRTNSTTSAFSSDRIAIEEDEAEDSDPEDSETPWICTLVISSVPSSANRLWEHEYYEKDEGIGLGLGLSKKESRRSYLSQGGHAPEASGESYAHSNVPPSPPPKSASFSPAPSTPTPNTISQHQQHHLQSASQPPATQPSKPARSYATDAPGILLRLKVGALSPAPHHPKVVAQMKVPYPLPDVEVTRASVRRRVLTPAGVARPIERANTFASANTNGEERERPKLRSGLFGYGSGNGNGENESEGLVLTAEEIKDVLSCTAFWIVVREGFGGVGKVNRKGDGWKIRG
ncbi:hypothetical protein A7U60_g7033 [Sanghuangporus baumii]|uniref:Uncharacterized protein n=1 Tax=Sanghuangporus baumii TaxID=108892 RepID=A0A9Q5HTW0_SANBA|nr:hypothetical protein A7U60_g7033 [Sanghuangporus baumii]